MPGSFVERVSLPGEDELEPTRSLRDRTQEVGIAQDQGHALVLRRPAREADREDIGIELHASGVLYVREEMGLRVGVGAPDLLLRHSDRIAQQEGVGAPAGDLVIVEPAEDLPRPGGGVHAVGDAVDLVPREHRARHLTVLLGHAVHVLAQVHGELRHVKPVVAPEHTPIAEIRRSVSERSTFAARTPRPPLYVSR